jgi:hypothetical protein
MHTTIVGVGVKRYFCRCMSPWQQYRRSNISLELIIIVKHSSDINMQTNSNLKIAQFIKIYNHNINVSDHIIFHIFYENKMSHHAFQNLIFTVKWGTTN